MTNNSMQKPAIVIKDVTKSFKIPLEASSGLKQKLVNTLKGRKGYRDFVPLNNISFTVNEGEFFGIVGRNGSGKSTLLKTIAGIYEPNKGSVVVNGTLVPFIELGVGFNPELTGRENVFLNGALLGFSRREMESMYDSIVDFSELHDFMDERLKNYSSGMQVRLAFSIAIRAEGDILLLDEVLAVGDEAFQQKCNDYFEKIRKNKKKTIILVTHSMESVRKYCSRAMLIVDGEIKEVGSPDKVANAYSDIFINERIAELEKDMGDAKEKTIGDNQLSNVQLDSIRVIQSGKDARAIKFRDDFSLELNFSSKEAHDDLTMGIHVFDQSGRDMLAISTRVYGDFKLKKGKNTVRFDIQNIFTDGDYYVNLAVEDNNTKRLLIQSHELAPFSIVGLNLSKYSKLSLTHPKVEMYLE